MIFGKNNLRSIIFMLAFAFPFCLAAQESEDFRPLRGTVKVSFLDMVDPAAPAFMLAVEQGLSKRMGVQLEGGIITSFDGEYYIVRDLEGYKFRGELRFYEGAGFTQENFSWGPQFMYKYDESKSSDTFSRADGAYFQKFEYLDSRRVMALHINLSTTMAMGKIGVLEIAGWVGLRRLDRKLEGVPDDAVRQEDFAFTWTEEGVHYFPSLGLAIRAGLAW